MDPNATMQEIHRIQRDLERSYQQGDEYNASELGRELSAAMRDLDEYLTRGGFLPDRWADQPEPIGTMWGAPVDDNAELYVQVDGVMNVVLVLAGKKGMRRRSTVLENVDSLHNQLEEARSFAQGSERNDRVERRAAALDSDH